MSNIEMFVRDEEQNVPLIDNNRWAESNREAAKYHREAARCHEESAKYHEAGDHAKATDSLVEAYEHNARAAECKKKALS